MTTVTSLKLNPAKHSNLVTLPYFFLLFYIDEDNVLMGIENLAVFSNETEDPYVTNQEDEDSDEDEDFNLLPTDNLIAVGHVEGDAAILEIYGQ